MKTATGEDNGEIYQLWIVSSRDERNSSANKTDQDDVSMLKTLEISCMVLNNRLSAEDIDNAYDVLENMIATKRTGNNEGKVILGLVSIEDSLVLAGKETFYDQPDGSMATIEILIYRNTPGP